MQKLIFLAGLHRSGTSLLHEILREHPDISGISGSGVPEDEGQHLQNVYKPAKYFGGPGKFAFDKRSRMDETHFLATKNNGEKIFSSWRPYVDSTREYFIEKSPPNIVKTRFLQEVFPGCKFIVILRHPLAVAYATRKWSHTSIRSLLEHSILAYEIFFQDINYLDAVRVIRYEDFVSSPNENLNEILDFLGLSSMSIKRLVKKDVNDKYFSMWDKERLTIFRKVFLKVPDDLEARANNLGYSIIGCRESQNESWASRLL